MKNWTIIGGVVLVLAILGAIGANHPNSERPTTAPQQPIEYQLALVDAGGLPDDVTVNRFRSLLGQLDDKYAGGAQQIADRTVVAQKLLKQKGVSESLLNIMEGLNQILPDGVHDQQYDGMLAMYITMRDKGSSHAEAVESLREASAAIENAAKQ